MIDVMLYPLLVCLVLSAIHAYLGAHIIQRGVIFVDLALAQVASLGATCAFLFGYNLHSPQSYFLSLTFSFLGAFLLAATRTEKGPVPHEAIIGIIYVLAAAGAVLVLSLSPDGGEELKALLIGHILFVNLDELLYVLTVYGIVALLLSTIHSKLVLISKDMDEAKKAGLRIGAYDFAFYGLFAVVVTSSVELAGVLLVFSLLVIPSVCAAFLTSAINTRLLIAWGIGSATCFLGILLSYYLDLPTGASIVCAFAFPLAMCGVFLKLRNSRPA